MNENTAKIEAEISRDQGEADNKYASLNLVDLELVNFGTKPVSQRRYGPLDTDGPATCLLFY